MNGRFNAYRASRNPIVQILSVIGVAILLIGAVVMGAVIFAIVLGLFAVLAAVFSVRLWWLRRKMRKSPPPGSVGRYRFPQGGGELIEAEYTVVSERKISRDRD